MKDKRQTGMAVFLQRQLQEIRKSKTHMKNENNAKKFKHMTIVSLQPFST
jgi:hypothetical protein